MPNKPIGKLSNFFLSKQYSELKMCKEKFILYDAAFKEMCDDSLILHLNHILQLVPKELLNSVDTNEFILKSGVLNKANVNTLLTKGYLFLQPKK